MAVIAYLMPSGKIHKNTNPFIKPPLTIEPDVAFDRGKSKGCCEISILSILLIQLVLISILKIALKQSLLEI